MTNQPGLHHSLNPLRNKITNKALGFIGQKIHDLRQLKEYIHNGLKNPQQYGDYAIAAQLQAQDPEAFKIMEIKIDCSHVEVGRVISNIDTVLRVWRDQDNREKNWRTLIPILKELEPYLIKKCGVFCSLAEQTANIDKVVKFQITGNAAWKAYYAATDRANVLEKINKELEQRIENLEASPDSSPFPDASDY